MGCDHMHGRGFADDAGGRAMWVYLQAFNEVAYPNTADFFVIGKSQMNRLAKGPFGHIGYGCQYARQEAFHVCGATTVITAIFCT